jgi:transposase, IS5 family
MVRQPGFFDVEERLAGLSAKGDGLERLSAVVDFELFRPELERAVPRADRSQGGRPPFDHVLMFKVLILQTQNNLGDERTEFYLRDRLTWMRFLGLGLGDPVPDANTIWTFREALTRAGAIERLFELFDRQLRATGYLAMSGQLVDASIVAAPKQRNTRAEKQALKEGRVPEDWQSKPAKLRQKDRDARWTVKYTKARPREDGQPQVDLAIPLFGYQNHVSADRRHRLIRKWQVTDAAAHAGSRLKDLLDPTDTASDVWADSERLSVKEERGPAPRAHAGEPHPPQEAGRPTDAGPDGEGERQEIGGAGARRACLRRAEGPHGFVRPHHRSVPGNDQDRACQSGLQHAPAALAGTAGHSRVNPAAERSLLTQPAMLSNRAPEPSGPEDRPRGCCPDASPRKWSSPASDRRGRRARQG